jgi:radical SAM superfamily enzyme YgiQ (UPF0313 family)
MNDVQTSIRICLIDVKVPYSYGGTPLNLLSLGSYLVERGVLPEKNIKIINSTNIHSVEYITQFKPDIIGLSVVTPAFPYALKLASLLKKKLHPVIIIGGHHITGIPELFDEPFDAGVIGEGEGALEDIIRLIQNGKSLTPSRMSLIPNLVYKDTKGTIVKNPMRPLLKPEAIPSYQWSLLEPEEIVQYETVVENGKARTTLGAPIFSSRGCPYQCVFCARTVIWKTGKAFRLLPMDHVMADIEYLYRKLHITSLWIYDDTFAVSKERIRQLIQALKKKGILGNIVLPQVFVRANLIDEEFVQLLKELGVLTVFMGVESGSRRILKYLKNDSLQVFQVKNAVKLFAKYDIRIVGSFMLFVPGEKPADLDKTYQLASWLAHEPNAQAIGMYITVPFPGTRLWEDSVIKNKIDITSLQWKNFVTYHSQKSIANLVFFRNGFTNKQLDNYWGRMYKQMDYVDKHISSLPGWKESKKEVELFNARRVAWLEMKYRFNRIIHNPSRLMSRIGSGHVWKYVVKDIRRITRIRP